jgi:hypothetical protein
MKKRRSLSLTEKGANRMPSTENIAKMFLHKIKNVDFSAYAPKKWDYQKLSYPFSYMFHPNNAGYDIKYGKRGSLALAHIIAFLYFLTTLISKGATGFVFNMSMPESLNFWLVFVQTVILLLLWAVSNWSLCTLMDGEGKFLEIWICTCYSMLPAVLISIPVVLLSNWFVLEEAAFLNIANIVINGWCFILMMFSVMIVQQYSFKKTILSMFLTAVGVAAAIFLFVLLFSLFQQFYTFANTIFKEISFRI